MRHKGQTFTNEVIVLDNNSFENCTFEECKFVYSGGSFGLLGKVTVKGPISVTFKGPAEGTMHLLRTLYGLDPEYVVQMLSAPPEEAGPIAEA